MRARSPRRLISSECRRAIGRIGEDATSSVGVEGNKNPSDDSEVGDDDWSVMLEALDADVSVRARVNRSSLSEATAAESVPLTELLLGLLNSRRFVCGTTSSL